MKKKLSAQKRARVRHLLSYLLISLIPILLCGILLINSTYDRRTEQEDASVCSGLTLFSNTYSALMGGMDACSGHMADNISGYIRSGSTAVSSQLVSYQKNYSLFSSVFYYGKGSDNIYTTSGIMNYHSFELAFADEYGVDLNMTALFTGMNAAISNCALRSRAAGSSHSDGEYIFYLRPIPALSANPTGVMVFAVSAESLRSLLNECVPDCYSFYMYSDQYLSWLFRSDSGPVETALQEKLNRLSTTGTLHTSVAGKDYLLLRIKSESDSMYHMLAYDTGNLYTAFAAERMRSLLLLLATLLATGVLAYVLHRYMYMPIDELFSLPLPDLSDDDTQLSDPIDRLAFNTLHMIDQNEQLTEQINEHRMLLRTQSLTNLICGSAAYGNRFPLDEPDGTLHFAYPEFTVIYAECSDMPPDLFRHGEAREIPGADYCMYIVPLHMVGQLALLINHTAYPADVLANIARSTLAGLDIKCSATGVGLCQNRIERIPVSLMQAQAVLRNPYNPDGINYFTADNASSAFTGFLPFSGKLLLTQCIRNGQKDIALATLKQLHADIMPFASNDTVLRSWCFFLSDAVISALHENNQGELIRDISIDEFICLPREEYMARLESVIARACDNISSQRELMLSEKQDSIILYLNQHFTDADMSLNRLSDEFKFSESYITRFIKEKTGMSFLQYISSLRMDYVRRHLRETDMPIKDIVAQAGYMDIANFTRKFRQIEGCTPGAYREAHTIRSNS